MNQAQTKSARRWLPKTLLAQFYIGLATILLTAVLIGVGLHFEPELFDRLLEEGLFSHKTQNQPMFFPILLAFGLVLLLVLVFLKQLKDAQTGEQALEIQKFTLDKHAIVRIIDRDGFLLYVNDLYCQITGYSRAEVLGHNERIFHKDAKTRAFYAPMIDAIGQGQVWQGVIDSVNRQEEPYWIQATVQPLPGRKSKAEQFILIGTEITLLVRTQALLAENQRLVAAANQAKSEFLTNLSHEVRTPLGGMLGMTDLALDLASSDTQKSYLTLAKSSGQSLMTVLNDILDISRIESGWLTLEPVEFSLSELLTGQIQSLAESTLQKGLALDLQIDADIPASVWGDPGRIKQVIANVMNNALEVTQKGRISVVSYATALEADGFEFHLAVKDAGAGMPDDRQKNVFKAFSQDAAGQPPRYGSTGLGLVLSARLLALMGGKIELESEEGMGSTFSITLRLPRAPERVDLTAPALPVPGWVLGAAASWPVPISVPLQVLVADDHVVNQILCKTMLQKMGHVVTIANNGEEALALFGERAWDLVLMDMQMPTMDGLAATRLIRLSEPSGRRTPIVAMTANVMASDQQACLAAGMDDFMSKPFKLTTLQGLINRFDKRVSVVEGLK